MPLALFAHGFDGNHDQWNVIGKAVQQAGYRVVFLDPPGHGASKAGQAETLSAAWPDAQLFATDDLGHNRILQDQTVVRKVAGFLESL